MGNKSMVLGASFVSLAAISLSTNAAILVIDDGQLLGADNVNVLGTNYDVRFVEGSCIDEFNNCTDFTFDTAASAIEASNSLANQVFIGVYDSNPELTFGIESFTNGAIWTPFVHVVDEFTNEVTSSFFSNSFGTSSDGFGGGSLNPFFDMSNQGRTYANWTISIDQNTTPDPVPVPAAAWLFGSGLLGLIGIARRKKA